MCFFLSVVVVDGDHPLAAMGELSRKEPLAATYIKRAPATGRDRPQHHVVIMNVVVPGVAHGSFIITGRFFFPFRLGMNPSKSFRIRDRRRGWRQIGWSPPFVIGPNRSTGPAE